MRKYLFITLLAFFIFLPLNAKALRSDIYSKFTFSELLNKIIYFTDDSWQDNMSVSQLDKILFLIEQGKKDYSSNNIVISEFYGSLNIFFISSPDDVSIEYYNSDYKDIFRTDFTITAKKEIKSYSVNLNTLNYIKKTNSIGSNFLLASTDYNYSTGYSSNFIQFQGVFKLKFLFNQYCDDSNWCSGRKNLQFINPLNSEEQLILDMGDVYKINYISKDYIESMSASTLPGQYNIWSLRAIFNSEIRKNDAIEVYYQLADYSSSAQLYYTFNSLLMNDTIPYNGGTKLKIYVVERSFLPYQPGKCTSFKDDIPVGCSAKILQAIDFTFDNLNEYLPYIKKIMTSNVDPDKGHNVSVLLSSQNYIGYSINNGDLIISKEKKVFEELKDISFSTSIKFYSCNDNLCNDVFDSKEYTTSSFSDYILSVNTNNFFSNFKLNNFGFSQIITFPLNLMRVISATAEHNQCSSIVLPFIEGTNLKLECVSKMLPSDFDYLINLYQIITNGLIAYFVGISTFKIIKNIQDPDNSKIEVSDL